MIFIDTGAFIARYVVRDHFHKEALRSWEKLAKKKHKLFTSNFVLDELITLLARKTDYAFSVKRAESIFASQILTILRPQAEDEIAALRVFKKYADQEMSYTDCVSFVLMEKNKIHQTFSYDQHFKLAGFTLWS